MTSTVEPFAETARQAAELEAMRRMLAASRGRFSVAVAICNSPALRDYLIERLQSETQEIRSLAVPEGTQSILEAARAAASKGRTDAIFIVGLEKLLPSDDADFPVLRALNASREGWREALRCPAVIWLPEYAATLLADGARDFWAWVSHRFEFVSEMAGAVGGMADIYSGQISLAANLNADSKKIRMAELEQRIHEAGDPAPDGLAIHLATWLNEMGFLHFVLGDLEEAEALYRKALEINERLGHQEGMAANYGNLGIIYQTRGDLEAAEAMFRTSLEIEVRVGRQEGMAADYGNLGEIYQTRGDLEEAESLYRKALEINERLGRQEGMAADYGNLGAIYRTRGGLEEAEAFYRKALEINERLGLQEGMAVNYGNLGIIYQTRGDLEEAESLHRKALEINERLGRQEGMAIQYGNLGAIYQTRGDLEEAEAFYRKAFELFAKIGMEPQRAQAAENIARLTAERDGADSRKRPSRRKAGTRRRPRAAKNRSS